MKKIVYLTGFMGAGKSTIGPILANTLGWDFFDLDKEIENNTGLKIKDIFASSGEDHFRDIEENLLKNLSAGNQLIISLGGGTISAKENFSFIKGNGILIYLKSEISSIFKRLKNKRDRPILLSQSGEGISESEFFERISELYNHRKKFYDKADFVLNTDKISIGGSVDRIVKYLYSIRYI
jgi:shikimate kinase